MSEFNSTVIGFFAVLTLLGQLISGGLIVLLLLSRFKVKNTIAKKITSLVNEYFVICVLTISTIATLGSLTFSEILGFTPCKLCWFQRIFMYPQVVIAGVALLTSKTKIRTYILSLSVIGFLIAVYHILVQSFPTILECSDEVAKCSAKEFATFGYITIPVMSATAFFMLILISLLRAEFENKK